MAQDTERLSVVPQSAIYDAIGRTPLSDMTQVEAALLHKGRPEYLLHTLYQAVLEGNDPMVGYIGMVALAKEPLVEGPLEATPPPYAFADAQGTNNMGYVWAMADRFLKAPESYVQLLIELDNRGNL